MGGSDRHFPATEWTRLLDHSQKEAILAELCTKYWKPLYSYLRSSGFGNDKAKDLVQDFFTEKVIDQELVQQADRTRGKLRTFLLTALRNHVINAGRSQKVPAMLHGAAADGIANDGPEAAYNRAWADQLLQDVLAQLRAECRERGKAIHWRLFHEWLLEPRVDQQRPQ
ncbi:MAG: RNA polymerase sigma factor, partial [Planctomycetota bacterium]